VRLRGITGSANNTYTPPVGQRFNSIHTDAGIIGSFAGLTEPASGLAAGTQFDAVYSATDMDLVVTPVSYANLTPIGVTDTANRMSLGAAIDSYRLAPGIRMTGDRNPVLTALYSLPAGSIGPAMDQIAGSVLGDQMNTALAIDRLFSSATVDHRNGSQGVLSVARTPTGRIMPINRALAPSASGIDDGSPFWATAVGDWSNTATDFNAPGYVANTAGVVIGLDLDRRGSVTGGVALGYAQGNVTAKNDASASVQSERIVAYGSYATEVWRLDGEVGFAANQYRSSRDIVMGSLSRTAKGGSDGFAFSLDAAVHYGDGFATPFLETRYDYVTRSAFTETHAGDLSLIVNDSDIAAPRTLLGIDIDLSEMAGAPNPAVSLGTRLAWAHDYSRIDGQTDAALTGASFSNFTALSSRVGYESGIFNLSASAVVDQWTSLFGEYHAEFRTRQVDQFVQLGLRMEW
jgi:outer membrane autotransporter protein